MFYKKPNICEPCSKNCALCKYIIRSDTFFGTDDKEYKVKGYINGKTSNLNYPVRESMRDRKDAKIFEEKIKRRNILKFVILS
jgi:hypothetical protein